MNDDPETYVRHAGVVKNIVRVVHHAVDTRELVHDGQHNSENKPLCILRVMKNEGSHSLAEETRADTMTLHKRPRRYRRLLHVLLSGERQGGSHLLRAG